jgi:hypothetical protein
MAEVIIGFVRCGGAMAADECASAARAIRKLLSQPVKPPIDAVIDAGIVAPLVALLAHPTELLSFEAAWCLTNIASGTTQQCQAVVDANAVAPLIALLAHPSVDVKEQAVWALGAHARPAHARPRATHQAPTLTRTRAPPAQATSPATARATATSCWASAASTGSCT